MTRLLAIGIGNSSIYSGVQFIDEVDDLITYEALSEHFEVTEGKLNTTSQKDKWLHFNIDGKELYISKVAVRSEIGYNHLYSKGLVYGSDDYGVSIPFGAATTNQLKTIKINKKEYKCRLPKGLDQDLMHYEYTSSGGGSGLSGGKGHNAPNTQYSEWNRIFYPIVTDDPHIPEWDEGWVRPVSYTMADLQMRWVDHISTPGCFNWCQEQAFNTSVSSDFSSRIVRGVGGPTYLSFAPTTPVTQSYGWRAILELVE